MLDRPAFHLVEIRRLSRPHVLSMCPQDRLEAGAGALGHQPDRLQAGPLVSVCDRAARQRATTKTRWLTRAADLAAIIAADILVEIRQLGRGGRQARGIKRRRELN